MKNITIILFGATGDLSKRKIIPALYRAVEHKKIEHFTLIGVAFDEVTSEEMINAAYPFVENSDEGIWNVLHENSFYIKINFTESSDYQALNTFVQACERSQGIAVAHRLFYLATSASFFSSITSNCTQVGLLQRKNDSDFFWHRIVYEKPFGFDLESAREINACIASALNETQVYRIDHYLTKEIVSNIAMIRFTNCVLEPLWSNKYIDQVHIVLSEDGGIEGRGGYYDKAGALADVVQNHMLEMLALICMETPEKLTGDYIRVQRANILKKVRFLDGILGQYEGYLSEQYVSENSHTDTYALLKLAVDTPRWRGVPFYVKTGKKLAKKETIIYIKFKQVDCLLTKGCPTDSNWLTIQIAPEAIFSLTLNAKRPGASDQIMPVNMDFCHSCLYGLQTPQAYEVLLEEIIRGEQSVSVRFDEIEYAWQLIDRIAAARLPLYSYESGSLGPKEEKEFNNKHGVRLKQ